MSVSIALWVGQTTFEAAGLEELGARRVEDADDHRADVELLLRHLADHDVRVVAVGGDDDGVGVLDPRPSQQLDVHPVADVELARPVVAEADRARPRARR